MSNTESKCLKHQLKGSALHTWHRFFLPDFLSARPHAGFRNVEVGLRGLGFVVPTFRALSGRIKLTVRRHKLHKDSLFLLRCMVLGVGFGV